MAQIEKLKHSFRNCRGTFRYSDFERLLIAVGFEQISAGKTGGSRRKFMHRTTKGMIWLDEPHDGDPSDLFQPIRDIKITKDMLDLAKHIVEAKSAPFDPLKLKQPTQKRRKGSAEPKPIPSRQGGNVIDLMDALRRSYRDKKGLSHETSEPRRKA